MATATKENAVINFVYFCLNFPSDFIEKAFAEKPEHMRKHLKEKFIYYHEKNTSSSMIKFFTELDDGNQRILTKWIDENYKAFSHL